MNSECNFTVKSAYGKNLLRAIIWLFPFSVSLFMVWSTIFYKPEEWHVVGAWVLGFIFSFWGIYHSILYRAVLITDKHGFRYIERNKVVLQHKWSDIEIFKIYKDNSLDGTTAAVFIYKELEIGGVYSASYKQSNKAKHQEITIDDNGVEFTLPLGSDFRKKRKLVELLNRCKLLRTEQKNIVLSGTAVKFK